MKKQILVGIDLGTTTLKVVFLDAAAGELITTQIEEVFPVKTENPDWLEYDPKDWFDGIVRLLKRGFEAGVDPGQIAGIGFCGPTVMALLADENGAPLINSVHYNDLRHIPEVEELESLIGKECVEKNANYIGHYSGLCKLYWWKKNRPDIFKKADSIHTETSWMIRQLTGKLAWNRCEAGFYNVYNTQTREWDDDLIKATGFPRNLFPKLYDAWEIVGEVTEEAARLTGLHAGTPVVAGADDASPVALATGVINAGQGFMSVGSGGNLAANTKKPISHPTIITYPHCIPGLTTAITVMSSTGISYKWMRNTFCHAEAAVAQITGGDPYDYMSQAAANSKPGANGVVFLPYLDGEYTPVNDPNARGCFIGMDSGTSKSDMLRAVLEGVAFCLLDNINLVREIGGNLDEIIVAGGLTRSDFWMQIISDVTGCSLSLTGDSEGTAFGTALIVGLGVGTFSSCGEAVKKMIKIKRGAYKPNAENTKIYTELFEIYRALYPALRDIYSKLYSFREAYCQD